MVATSIQGLEVRSIVRNRLTISAILARWPLFVILAFEVIVSIAILNNTAFQDEALYLYAGRQIFNHWMGGPPVYDPYALYFSGYPSFYPVIGGLLDMVGGLELARTFSLVCMMGVTSCVYYITNKLFDRNSAIFAAAIYVSLGSVLFIGRLATYDAFCLVLIGLAAVIAYRVSTKNNPWTAVFIGPLLIAAVAAKYAALLFVLPVIGILVLYSFEKLGWWKMILRLAIVFCTSLATGVVAYIFMDKEVLKGLSLTTTNRVAIIQKTPLQLLLHIIDLGGVTYAAALLGLIIILMGKRYRLLALLLFASSLLVPAYHMYKQEFVSLDKHMAFSLFFAMPMVGFALAWLSGHTRQRLSIGRYWLSGLAVCIIVFTMGTQQAGSIYSGWANTTDLAYQLHAQLRNGSGRYLAEEIEVSRYSARDISEAWEWNGASNFIYIKSSTVQYGGDEAYIQAIKDSYFDVIELSFSYQPAQAHLIAQQMIKTRNYDLVSTIQFHNSFGIGYYYIWRKAVPGHGNFINLNQTRNY